MDRTEKQAVLAGRVSIVLVQMLLPTQSPDGKPFPDELLRQTRAELMDRFGGLTAYTRAPATGLWTSPDGDVEVDTVVMIEVLSKQFDREWWRAYAPSRGASRRNPSTFERATWTSWTRSALNRKSPLDLLTPLNQQQHRRCRPR